MQNLIKFGETLFRIINKLSLLALPNFLSLSLFISTISSSLFRCIRLSLSLSLSFPPPSLCLFLHLLLFLLCSLVLLSPLGPALSLPVCPFNPSTSPFRVSLARADPPFPLSPLCVASQMTMRKLRGSKSRAAHRTKLFYAFSLSFSLSLSLSLSPACLPFSCCPSRSSFLCFSFYRFFKLKCILAYLS